MPGRASSLCTDAMLMILPRRRGTPALSCSPRPAPGRFDSGLRSTIEKYFCRTRCAQLWTLKEVWYRRDCFSCPTLKRNRKEPHRMEINGRDLKRTAELLFELSRIARAVVLYKEPHRSVTAIKVHVARTCLASKKRPMCALVRTRVETKVRIDERKHEFCVDFPDQLKA